MVCDLLRQPGMPVQFQGVDWREVVEVQLGHDEDSQWSRVHIALVAALTSQSCRFLDNAAAAAPEQRLAFHSVLRASRCQNRLAQWLQPKDATVLATSVVQCQASLALNAELALLDIPHDREQFLMAARQDLDLLGKYAALDYWTAGGNLKDYLMAFGASEAAVNGSALPTRDHATPSPLARMAYALGSAIACTRVEHFMLRGRFFAETEVQALEAAAANACLRRAELADRLLHRSTKPLVAWLSLEAGSVFAVRSCAAREQNAHLRRVWNLFVEQELGQLQVALATYRQATGSDGAELLPTDLPEAHDADQHREALRQILCDAAMAPARGIRQAAATNCASLSG